MMNRGELQSNRTDQTRRTHVDIYIYIYINMFRYICMYLAQGNRSVFCSRGPTSKKLPCIIIPTRCCGKCEVRLALQHILYECVEASVSHVSHLARHSLDSMQPSQIQASCIRSQAGTRRTLLAHEFQDVAYIVIG